MKPPGRNDPCPCGSGRKYKKCCLARHEAARPRTTAPEPEEHFIAELRPDLDKKVDHLMERLERGEGRRIEPDLTALLDEHPNYHMTHYAMGVYQAMVMNNPRGAMPFFERAVKIFPPFPEAHFNLGNTARQCFDIVKAVAGYRAAERYSRNDDGIAGMARSELEAMEKALSGTGAFSSLDAYVANAKLFARAYECLVAQRFEEAIELFQRVLQENPAHVQSHGNMALAHAALGQKSAAMSCLDRALELDPDYEPARMNRCVVAPMREGEPLLPDGVEEVEFYYDRLRK